MTPTRVGPQLLLAASAILCVVGIMAALTGPAGLPKGAVLRELLDRLPMLEVESGLSAREASILWQLRMPRIVVGALVGAVLSISGAAYQGVFRNPLADPYLLGVAAGAGFGVTLAIAYAPGNGLAFNLIPVAAFAGALIAVAVTYLLGRSGPSGRTAGTLLLAGVAVASFMTAGQTFVQQRNSDTLREVYAWILGTLATASWSDVVLILPYAAVSVLVLLLHHRILDVLSLGDEEASTLGIDAPRVRLVIVLAATLGTAAAVSVSGLIGFVGIIVPHSVRLLVGTSYRRVLPLALIYGGAFLVLADLVARTALRPAEIPIGVVTAFFGAPFFLVVLRNTRSAS